MSYPYTTYQYPQYTTITTQPASRTIAVASPTSAGVNRRATVRNLAPVNTAPQYSTGVPISSGVVRSPTQVRPQRAHFAPLPTVPPLSNVPVVTRNGTRSRRANSVDVYRQGNVDGYDPYPTRSATVNYGSRIIGSQVPYDDSSFSARSRRAMSAPPIRYPRRQDKELEDFNVGSATSAGRLYDEPHLPLPYRDFSAGGRDTRPKVHRAETYGDRYGGPSPSSRGPGGASGSGHKGGGMFGWLVGHK